jgi:hypothetical protein
VVAQCYYLDFDDRNRQKPIYVYLNSTGARLPAWRQARPGIVPGAGCSQLRPQQWPGPTIAGPPTSPAAPRRRPAGCINEQGQAISADNEFYAMWAALGFTRAPLYTGVTWKAQNQAAVLLSSGQKGHR